MIRNKDLDYLVVAAMLLSGIYVATSGLIMDLFGLHSFFLHNYAGYLAAALATLHLALNWSRVVAYVRRRLDRSSVRESLAPPAPPMFNRRAFLIATLTAAGGFLLGWLLPKPRLVQLPSARPGLPAVVPSPSSSSPRDAAARDGGVQVDVPQGDIGWFYHRWSMPGYALSLGAVLDWGARPERFKTYSDAEATALPDPHGHHGLSLEEAIQSRRSIRDYTSRSLSLEQLSRLLHAAGGITAPATGYRAAPSAGALYPIETYVVVNDVSGLQRGLYHYSVAGHSLERVRAGDLRAELVLTGIGQEMLGQAQVCFILSAVFQRTRWRYRERTYRYVMLEAGHIGQNLYLAATSLGLGACGVGAFLDEEINRLLGVDGEQEAAVYLLSVGTV